MKRNLPLAASALLVIFMAGCGGGDGGGESSTSALANLPAQPLASPRLGAPPTAPDTLPSLPSTQGLARPRASGPLALPNAGYGVDTASREQVRLFYKTIYASSLGVASGWSGNVAGCAQGDTSDDFKAAILRRINWYRAMAGVPATVQFDAAFNLQAQQAAALMAANNSLSHSPPTSWTCYSSLPDAGPTAGKSNLALGIMGVDSITSYMQDPGTGNTAAGHRRWVLYPQTQRMGTGDIDGTARANALLVMDGNYGTARPAVRDQFVAWPAKGYTPYTTVYGRWSFAYPGADFSSATVTMKENRVPIATTKEPLTNGFGENTMVWLPGSYTSTTAWAKPASDTSYEVTISNVAGPGVPTSFTYTAVVFDPDTPGSGDGPLQITGSPTVAVGQAGAYSFSAVSGATSYQWRSFTGTPYTVTDGAEGGTGNFTVTTTGGYDVVNTQTSASGSRSFHLAHSLPTNQILLLNQQLVAGDSASITFKSRLGLSSPSQHAMVEVSADEGVSWTVVYEQAGQQQGSTFDLGETGFTTRTISLAAYANRSLRIRWRYAIVSLDPYYGAVTNGVGWYIDDISTNGMTAVTPGDATPVASAGFTLVPSSEGQVLLQARAGMFGYYADWGLIKPVTVTAQDPADCLFDWAERQLPGILSPHATSFSAAGFYVRYYAPVGLYLGLSSTDGHVYYYFNGNLVDVGHKSAFGVSGCGV